MKKGLLDFIIASISLAVFVLAFFYMRETIWLLVSSGLVSTLFLVLGILNRNKPLIYKAPDEGRYAEGALRELVLLSEENTEMAGWDLFGRTALVIGRDMGENQVDVNLADVTYASFIDIEHAVMNYAGEQWYIEDLHSENGVKIKKRGSKGRYKLAPEKPCKLDPGDVIFIAQTKLLVR